MEPIFKFKFNTFRDTPQKFYSALVFVAASFMIMSFTFDQGYAVIGTVLTIFVLPEIFFPFTYTFFEDKIIINRYFYKVERELSYYRKVYKDKNGIFLSPYRKPRRMENFRGVLIRVPNESKNEVYEFLKSRIEDVENKNK
ncbi:MAG: hypothetical protein JXR48_07625 [Candidatus Delongbacteria bacterium]|nr:hypothetical protein [Candidatus Delongbacteria bacterium]MBN2834820.1 hypothetical protein [Candidatus Delongbacteria bacterium]